MAVRARPPLLVFAAVTLLLIGGYVSYPSASAPIYPDLASSRFFDPDVTEPNANILLVSAFFPLAKSKHSLDEYEAWFTHFLQPIETDLYFFCPPEVVPLIQRMRGNKPIIIDTTYRDPQDVPPLNDYHGIYQEMHAWDKEKSYHGPGLYAVWNAKPFFLEKGLALAESKNGVKYDYAFWQDAGGMRDAHTYKHWPNAKRVVSAFGAASRSSGTPEDELIFFPWWWTPKKQFWTWKENDGPMDDTIAEGSFFGGRHKAIHDYATTYYAYHDKWLAQGLFVGKDQMLMNSLITLFPRHFFGVLLYDWEWPDRTSIGESDQVNSPLGACGSTWWYYQWWLADSDEREPTADQWLGSGAREMDKLHDRPKGSIRCRDTYLIMAEDLIRRSFGKVWWAPRTTLSWGQKLNA